MMLGFHGGKCCGIKVIHGFYNHPDEVVGELKAKAFNDSDACGDDVSSDDSFFTAAAPSETYRERFKRFLDFCDEHRPCGIIEVVLTDEGFWQQKKRWGEILQAEGFRIVNDNENSNSGNTCYIYHRNSNLPYKICDCCGNNLNGDGDECENCAYD